IGSVSTGPKTQSASRKKADDLAVGIQCLNLPVGIRRQSYLHSTIKQWEFGLKANLLQCAFDSVVNVAFDTPVAIGKRIFVKRCCRVLRNQVNVAVVRYFPLHWPHGATRGYLVRWDH